MDIPFEEKIGFETDDMAVINSIIEYYEAFFALQGKKKIKEDFEDAVNNGDLMLFINTNEFKYKEFSRHENRAGKYTILVLKDPIRRAADELNKYYELRKRELSEIGEKVLTDYTSYMIDYMLAREVYVWLLSTVEGIDFESQNDEKEHLLAALQRFFAMSYMEEHYGRETRIWFFKFLDLVLEYNVPVSMFCHGDRLFKVSIETVAGQKTAPKDMSVYKKLIKLCKEGKYSEGIEYLIAQTRLQNKRIISKEKFEEYKRVYYPDNLKRRTDDRSETDISEMEKNALLFLWEDCNMFVHAYPDRYVIDDSILCMYQAVHAFMETGSKYNAIDIYNCYCRRFLKGDKMQEFINMISSYENNASRLVQSHRDHYSHSVYVFVLGLAIFHTNKNYKSAFGLHVGNYRLKDIREEDVLDGFLCSDSIDIYCRKESVEENFLRLWGLTALFHDIGYQYEIPFAQILNTSDNKIIFRYVGFGEYTSFDKYIDELTKADETGFWSVSNRTYQFMDEYKKRLFHFDPCYSGGDCKIERIIAYHIVRFLKTRELDIDKVTKLLRKKPFPSFAEPYMDHAYFSGIIMFKQLILMFGLDDFPLEFMDAITAIVMHNKFFEKYLKGKGEPLSMQEHPLAYLLILCDELQCWDRTSFGKGSIQQLHAIDAHISFKEDKLEAEYIFDKRFINQAFRCDEEGHINYVEDGTLRKFYKGNQKGDGYITPYQFDINKKDSYRVSLSDFYDEKAYLYKEDDKRRVCKFAGDIADIVVVNLNENDKQNDAITLSVAASFDSRDKYRQEYLSETSMRHLYEMAKELFERSEASTSNFEYAPLADKLAYIAFVRAMGECLHSIGCFFTNEPKAFEIVEDFSDSDAKEDKEKIAKMLSIEKREMSLFCKAHLIDEFPDDKLLDMVKAFVKIICESRGVEVYKLTPWNC